MSKRPFLVYLGLPLLVLLVDMNLSIYGMRTDLRSLIVYWFGLTHSGFVGMGYGAILGCVEDSVLSSIIGPSILAGGAVGYLASFFSHTFFRWTPLLGFFVASVLTFFGGLAEYASLSIFHQLDGGLLSGLYPLALQSLLNGVLAIFLKPPENTEKASLR
jgi:cell shape-determining protein MreD